MVNILKGQLACDGPNYKNEAGFTIIEVKFRVQGDWRGTQEGQQVFKKAEELIRAKHFTSDTTFVVNDGELSGVLTILCDSTMRPLQDRKLKELFADLIIQPTQVSPQR